MSMNLYCNLVELRQTPTSITNMCLVQESGKVEWEVTGDKARKALWTYIMWLVGTTNGSWNSIKEQNDYRNKITEEIKSIQKIMNKKDLKVYQR